MKISLYLSVLLLALVVKIVTANVGLQHSPKNYCGSKLADIMMVVCKGNYNEPNLQKRSIIDSDVFDYKNLKDHNAVDYSYLPKGEAMPFKPSRSVRSVKRSIIDECCLRPCYLSELQAYCGSH